MKRFFIGLSSFALLSVFQVTALGQSPSREDLLRQLETKRAELQKLEEQFLAPSDEDRTAFAEFLKQPNTGIIRLLPREVYDLFPNKPSKLTIRGGGAYYSFARLTHEYGYGSDIELASGYLSVGFAGANYGLMIDLGDVSLDEITSDYPGARSLADYAAAKDEPQARVEQRQVQVGRILDGATYKERLPVKTGTTFLLRSINYDSTDVLVAFRVVRKDTDGSVIIAWRLLKQYPTPKLARNS